MSEMSARLPLLVVLGATGTGKSKLAIELALKFCGEIISADSMQVYRGLDIITNKVTAEERRIVSHHMLDLLDPHQEFTVQDFRNRALPIIEDIQRRGKMPVVVGGTNYYIEALLWKLLVDTKLPEDNGGFDASPPKQSRLNNASENNTRDSDKLHSVYKSDKKQEMNKEEERNREILEVLETKNLTNEELHERLKLVDPSMAAALHPNNRRKVLSLLEPNEIRALEGRLDANRFITRIAIKDGRPSGMMTSSSAKSLEVAASGRKHSELLQEQRRLPGGGDLGGPLRFPDAILLWLTCDRAILSERLDHRVDDMLKQGLVKELLDFHERYNQQNREADYTRGVFQSIGFKEFHKYLVMDKKAKDSSEGEALLQEGVTALKMVTRRYAGRQVKWIRNRFLRRPERHVPSLYGLDVSDLTQWDTEVRDKAAAVVAACLEDKPSPIPPLPGEEPLPSTSGSHWCDVCQRLFIGDLQWKAHQHSAKHYRAVKRKARLEATEVQSGI